MIKALIQDMTTKSLLSFLPGCLGITTCLILVCIHPGSASAATYSYDDLNHLTSVNYSNNTSITYSYDAAGNITAVTTVPDTSPPTVASHIPSSGATGVSPDSSITITFSEPVTEASALNAISVTDPGNAPVTGNISLDFDTVTFTPASALTSGATYAVNIAGTIDLANNVQTSSTAWSFTIASQGTAELTVLTDGNGSGTVTSTPEGIKCTSGSGTGCKASYPLNEPVTLNTLPPWYFGIDWTGCTASGNSCVVTMDKDKSVTATFGPAHNAQILSATGYFGKLADAYAAANPSGIIQCRESSFVVFEEGLLFDKPYTVTLDGGKDSGWNTIGNTSVKGFLKIKDGKVMVRGIKIFPYQ